MAGFNNCVGPAFLGLKGACLGKSTEISSACSALVCVDVILCWASILEICINSLQTVDCILRGFYQFSLSSSEWWWNKHLNFVRTLERMLLQAALGSVSVVWWQRLTILLSNEKCCDTSSYCWNLYEEFVVALLNVKVSFPSSLINY